MAQQVHANELRETVRAAFAHFDADGSGAIDATELRDLVAKLGGYLTDKELQTALSALDKDGNGAIDESEFTAWWMAQSSDLDGDGQVGELERAMERVKAFGQNRFHVDVHSAAWKGSLEAVRRLLEGDTELANAVDGTEYGCGNMPLHYAAYQGHVDVCAALLTGGAKINATNAFGCTALFLAAQQSRIGVVQLLLEHGADIRIAEREHKFTAVDVCSSDEVLAAFRARSGGVPGIPEPPTILKTTHSSVVVEWNAPTDRHDQIAPISGYKLRATPSSQSSSAASRSVLVGTQPTRFELDELQPETEYAIQVASINIHGISQFSAASAPAQTLPAPPPALSELHARGIDATNIELSWVFDGSSESTCVVQQCIDSQENLWKTVRSVPVVASQIVISNLFEGRKYSFRAAVLSSGGAQSDYTLVEGRTQKVAEKRPSITPLTSRRPRETLREIVSATHHHQRSEAKAASKELLEYPRPRDATEFQVRKPRLATLLRAAAKPQSQPDTQPNKHGQVRVQDRSEVLPTVKLVRSAVEHNEGTSAELPSHRTSPKHNARSSGDKKRGESVESGDDEDEYAYYDEPESDEEDTQGKDIEGDES